MWKTYHLCSCSFQSYSAPCAALGFFSIQFSVIVSNAVVKQCGLFMLLMWGRRAETTSSPLSWFGLPACVTGEHSVVLKAANKWVIVWIYPLLVFPGPGENPLVLVWSWTAQCSKLWAVLSSWCRNMQNRSFSAFRKILFSGCRGCFLLTGNLQSTGRLCREGEDYSQELIRQWVPRLAQWRPGGIQNSSFLSAKRMWKN